MIRVFDIPIELIPLLFRRWCMGRIYPRLRRYDAVDALRVAEGVVEKLKTCSCAVEIGECDPVCRVKAKRALQTV